ncbi:MAG: rhodanese-like domain-containing protein [Muribaculaceae bacterium]|nr:rhodanese-like domain-containing protein [Muribaculaceae bacterium]
MLDSASFINMNVDEFAEFIAMAGVQLLDVRTPEEFAEGHIQGAVNIDIYDPDFLRKAETALDKSRPVAVYCRSGRRSEEAAGMLFREGYNVVNLEGGILAWIEWGRPIV